VGNSGPDEPGALTPRERRALTRRPSDGLIIAVLAAAGLLTAFMLTVVTPLIPNLPELLNTTQADAFWVLTSALLASAISIPITGRLGDMFGKRRIVVALLISHVLGSVISALSDTLIPMVVGRVLQGIGLGVISLGISILRDVIHRKRLSGAIALVSATLGIGGALGLPLAAWVAQSFDWHLLFWGAAIAGVLLLVAVVLIVPVSTLRSGGRFDFVGALGLAIGLVGILLGVTKGGEWGWLSPVTLGLLSGGVAVLAVWGWFELRVKDPLVDLRVASRRPVLLTNLASISVGFGFFVATGTLPIMLEAPLDSEVGLGLPLLAASLCLMPLGIVMFLMSPVAARLTNARGPRAGLLLGTIIVATAYLVATLLMGEIWHVLLVSTIVGLGVGLAYSSMPNLIMRAVPPSETAAANGLNAVMRTLGSTIAAAIIGVILAAQPDATGTPSAGAFRTVFILGASVVLAGAIVTAFIPRREPGYETASIPVQAS